jgi:hypothetical protein
MANADVATADAKITATNLIIISSIPSNLVEGWINSALPTKSNRPGRRQVGFSWVVYRRSPDGGCQGFSAPKTERVMARNHHPLLHLIATKKPRKGYRGF